MDPDSSPKAKPLVPAIAIAFVVGGLVLAKPWLVEHLGIDRFSMQDRLLWMVPLLVVCAICVFAVKKLNKTKPNA
jgi:hypothetical protein